MRFMYFLPLFSNSNTKRKFIFLQGKDQLQVFWRWTIDKWLFYGPKMFKKVQKVQLEIRIL